MVKTPICDFINAYIKENNTRLHMPGHKGIGAVETFDITEIHGMDSLYSNSGVILESEKIASRLFGSYKTCYSTEGSTQCIKAMLHLAKMYKNPRGRGYILAGRNAHSSLVASASLLDFDIEWLFSSTKESYISCNIDACFLDNLLESKKKKPFAVYVTSPDYLGNILDIKGIASVCNKHGVLLIVDNAHGAYLKFLENSMHPLELGAHMCCDSAHKTLPALTGGAYLHISKNIKRGMKRFICENVKSVMALYGSTSPSFLILRSLDMLNPYIASKELVREQGEVISYLDKLKNRLHVCGFDLLGSEPLKLSICPLSYGYTGYDLADILKKNGFIPEFFDRDCIVLMVSAKTSLEDLYKLESILTSLPKKNAILKEELVFKAPLVKMPIKKAAFSKKERIPLENALYRVFGDVQVSCPPAVSPIVCGEVIDENIINLLKYYGFDTVTVIK